MGVDCVVKFENNPDKVFYSGQSVSGVVDINIHDELKIRKLYLSIEGIGDCAWQDSHETKDSEGTAHTLKKNYTNFQGKIQYLKSEKSFIDVETELPIGQHTYNFDFVLPADLPSSITENKGQIKYKTRVVFARPWSTDLNYDFEFKVIQPIDLSADSECKLPCQEEEIKNFCCLFCASENVVFSASLPKTGYIVGETIPIKATVNNPSSVDILNLLVTFIKKTTYHSQTPQEHFKEEQHVLHKIASGESIKNGKREYEISFVVPQTVASTNHEDTNRVIEIDYELQVKAKTPGCYTSPSLTFPIIIGTIPTTGQNDSPNEIQSCSIVQKFVTQNSVEAKINTPTRKNSRPKHNDSAKPTGFALPADQINDF